MDFNFSVYQWHLILPLHSEQNKKADFAEVQHMNNLVTLSYSGLDYFESIKVVSWHNENGQTQDFDYSFSKSDYFACDRPECLT